MSLYIIKDDDGNVLTRWHDFENTMVHAALYDGLLEPAVDIELYGGHVVTLIEEPEKVVLSKEQAETLLNAFVNGYTVEEKKYNLVLGTNGSDKYTCSTLVKETSVEGNIFLFINPVTIPNDLTVPQYQFTQEEIDKYNDDFWIKNIDLNDYKIEVTDDDIK